MNSYDKGMRKIASIVAINISKVRGVAKESIPFAECRIDHGIVGDAHADNWHRQVSFLGQESVDTMIQKGAGNLSPGDFAENITTEGILLYELPIGTQMSISEVIFEVTQIGKECHHGCAIFQRVGDCVMPREGIFCKVLKNGIIRTGDKIVIDMNPHL